MNGSDVEFTSEICDLIEIDNFIDYYIFLNLLSAWDNTGKNTFLFRQSKQDKLAIIPWDMDGTWGIFWDGTHIGYADILSNNLYDRLLELNSCQYRNKLKSRWNYLRTNIFRISELQSIFDDSFYQINKSDVINIENDKWSTKH